MFTADYGKTCRGRGHTVSPRAQLVYLRFCATAHTKVGLCSGHSCASTAVLFLLDCNSTALRPFDDIRHTRRHRGLSIGQRHCG